MPSHSEKKHSSGAARTYQIEPELFRKPLPPVSSSLSSKANITNFPEDQKKTQDPKMQIKLPGSEKPPATPSRPVIVSDDENRTPRTMPIPVPTTPSTLSVTTLTVKTPPTPRGYSGACPVDRSDEPVEYSFEELRAGSYSFEEVRAGFVNPK